MVTDDRAFLVIGNEPHLMQSVPRADGHRVTYAPTSCHVFQLAKAREMSDRFCWRITSPVKIARNAINIAMFKAKQFTKPLFQ